MNLLSSVLLILLSISIAVTGQVLLKIGIDRIGINGFGSMKALTGLFSGIIKSPMVLTGLFLYFISAAIWLVILSTVDLSFAYPFIGLSYVIVLILSKFILKEEVNPLRWAGAFIITVGVVIISRG
ncbi:MAG: EamA family transporter [Actinobacteria bacterium]|nr:EamA family transporter [Actinomycetota bacterium]